MTIINKKPPKFSIVMANFNGYIPTFKAVTSLKNLTYPNFDIIVVDDCSSDDSPQKLIKEYPEIILLRSPKNGGLNRSYNLGIDYALRNDSEYIFTCQNDTYDYSINILEAILEEFEKDSKIGMVGPTILDSFGNFRWNGENKNKFGILMNISECLVVKRDVYEKIGLFNEKLIVYFEDIDLIARLRNAGYLTSSVNSVQIVHSGQVTFSKQNFYPNYLRSRNVTFFIRRHCTKKKFVVISYNIYSQFLDMVVPKIIKAMKNFDFLGVLYLIIGYFSGVIVGCLLNWEEEKPWTPQNTYPHHF